MQIAVKSTGDQLTAAELNQITDEIEYVITGSGESLDSSDETQLATAVGIRLLSRTLAVDLNAAVADTALYTVPTGKSAIITHVVIHSLTASGSPAEVEFGITAAFNEWRAAQDLSALNVAGDYTVLYMHQATSDDAESCPAFAAEAVFSANVTVASTVACICTMDVHGYLI